MSGPRPHAGNLPHCYFGRILMTYESWRWSRVIFAFTIYLDVLDNTIWAISLPIIHHHIFRDSFFCTLAEINQQKQKLPTMEYCYKTFESFSTVLWFVSSLVLFFILHRTLTRKISITYSANVFKVGSISIMGSSMEADFINAFNTMPI